MRTTLTLDDDVAVQIEALRRKRRVSLKAVVNETLRRGLANAESVNRPGTTFRTRIFDAGTPLLPSIDNVAEALAAAEGERFR
jgi:hypothetical protein